MLHTTSIPAEHDLEKKKVLWSACVTYFINNVPNNCNDATTRPNNRFKYYEKNVQKENDDSYWFETVLIYHMNICMYIPMDWKLGETQEPGI